MNIDKERSQVAMNQNKSKITWLAWILCGLAMISVPISFLGTGAEPAANGSTTGPVNNLVWGLLPVLFAILATLLITRRPRNPIGWLLMTPALMFVLLTPGELYLNRFATAPAPTTLHLLLFWFTSLSWLLLIFPLLFILQLFPTGESPSPRWRRIVFITLGWPAIFLFLATFSQNLGPVNGWFLPNPIGFIPNTSTDLLITPWVLGLVLLMLLSVASLFVRYRRAARVEREQIKWLLYACAVFAAVFLPAAVPGYDPGPLHDLLLDLAVMGIPIAIAIAILRYRLYDIDVIIRKTLVYAVLSGLLALVYFGIVALLQSLFESATGESSPIAIVFSTLIIAVLFNPLRQRVQAFIDRRFFRSKYDAAQTLARFAQKARDEVEIDALTAELVSVVQETMQPERATIWLKEVKQ